MRFYKRKNPRLRKYDYAGSNYYFITICTYEKKCIFGSIKKLNDFGIIAEEELCKLSSHYHDVFVDNYIVMPNHIHAIIVIKDSDSKDSKISLSTIIGLYKSGVSRRIKKINIGENIWQRSFHDHIIRNQKEYETIWQYIQYNDQKWESDCFYME